MEGVILTRGQHDGIYLLCIIDSRAGALEIAFSNMYSLICIHTCIKWLMK